MRGRQPDIFLAGPDTRNQKPPDTDALTRILDITSRNSMSNPTADPVIDKCGSWVQWVKREGLVKLTIL